MKDEALESSENKSLKNTRERLMTELKMTEEKPITKRKRRKKKYNYRALVKKIWRWILK